MMRKLLLFFFYPKFVKLGRRETTLYIDEETFFFNPKFVVRGGRETTLYIDEETLFFFFCKYPKFVKLEGEVKQLCILMRIFIYLF